MRLIWGVSFAVAGAGLLCITAFTALTRLMVACEFPSEGLAGGEDAAAGLLAVAVGPVGVRSGTAWPLAPVR